MLSNRELLVSEQQKFLESEYGPLFSEESEERAMRDHILNQIKNGTLPPKGKKLYAELVSLAGPSWDKRMDQIVSIIASASPAVLGSIRGKFGERVMTQAAEKQCAHLAVANPGWKFQVLTQQPNPYIHQLADLAVFATGPATVKVYFTIQHDYWNGGMQAERLDKFSKIPEMGHIVFSRWPIRKGFGKSEKLISQMIQNKNLIWPNQIGEFVARKLHH